MLDVFFILWIIIGGIYWVLKKEKIGKYTVITDKKIKFIKMLMIFILPVSYYIFFQKNTWISAVESGASFLILQVLYYALQVLICKKIRKEEENINKKEVDALLRKRMIDTKIVVTGSTTIAVVLLVSVFLPK